ncbi:MAG TPA: formylglycine-generating enzyme family protein [Lacibacter sp.]|nr:formylglycine-generating enzyme family protein [Lacibacter sp.]HMO87793.1 formylglycine-generating enzyme family protein [Lacibacter sp.]HMP88450.1 formylglycine-generating enzyme family protein [Lacibacter sp.]
MPFLFLLFASLYTQTAGAQALPEMVRVEGGTFIMGLEDPVDESDSSARPLRKVTLRGFRMAKTETTVAQWRTYCNAAGRQMPNAPAWGWIDSHPIVNISWEDAVAYCKWLSDSTKKTYRLPTEAEWEYAARGGNKSKGFTYAGGEAMYMSGWFDENSNAGTQPVARKRPNELGLFDLSGNVWEWCQDWYGAYPPKDETNPQGQNENQYFKVLRGGSWNYILAGCRLGHRNYFSPESRLSDYGFRVVLEEEGSGKPDGAPAANPTPPADNKNKKPKN